MKNEENSKLIQSSKEKCINEILFLEQINTEISKISSFRDNNKKYFRRVYIIQLISLLLIPVMIKLDFTYSGSMVISLSSIAAVMQGISGYSDFKEHWIRYKKVTEQLELLKQELEHYLENENTCNTNDISNLYFQYQNIILQNSQQWSKSIGKSNINQNEKS